MRAHGLCVLPVQVEVVLGPAAESIARLAAQGKRFDLAFLDADKTGYLAYYNQASTRLLPVFRAACLKSAHERYPPTEQCLLQGLLVSHSMQQRAVHIGCVPRAIACTGSLSVGGCLQLMDLDMILPGGAIVVDNTLMKVCMHGCFGAMQSVSQHRLACVIALE